MFDAACVSPVFITTGIQDQVAAIQTSASLSAASDGQLWSSQSDGQNLSGQWVSCPSGLPTDRLFQTLRRPSSFETALAKADIASSYWVVCKMSSIFLMFMTSALCKYQLLSFSRHVEVKIHCCRIGIHDLASSVTFVVDRISSTPRVTAVYSWSADKKPSANGLVANGL